MTNLDYLHPEIPIGTRIHDVPLVRATRQSMKGFGEIVRDPKTHKIEIVTWPARGWRRLDENTGNEGGTTEGVFACAWQGNELVGHNEAVGGHYVRLVAPRKYGKTSLLGRVLRDGERSEGLAPILVDLYGVLSIADVTVRIERAGPHSVWGRIDKGGGAA